MNSNYNKYPFVNIPGGAIFIGWTDILQSLSEELLRSGKKKQILIVEAYQGVYHQELTEALKNLNTALFVHTISVFHNEEEIRQMTYPFVTDDPIFGYMNHLQMKDFLDDSKLQDIRNQIRHMERGLVVIYGHGASLVMDNPDVLVWSDMPRWEIQLRMKRNEVTNLGLSNALESFSEQYKRGYFVDWRVCDRLKKQYFDRIEFFLDTTKPEIPKMIPASTFKTGLKQTVSQPFRVVPFFDPGPWGGQWMKEVCDLDREAVNYAWCFDCVPEENSLLFNIKGEFFETPSQNIVFFETEKLLGEKVEARFGKEFPIRFDFLDTMDGGNLSFQVHPQTGYIQEKFGMHYTQDESYYLLDACDDAAVFLGLKPGVDPAAMKKDLLDAQEGMKLFEACKYVNQFPAKKHDHFLIPAGTVHCSGKNSMVLEISSTPYIFTFKMWDWGRMGMDGKPRPINIEHGFENIRWERDTRYAEEYLVNKVEVISKGEGWKEERTGLHANEFIETRRHWFTNEVLHDTCGTVNVLNLVEGREAIVESPEGKFSPFIVHYAETFIVPAAVGKYSIRPFGESEGKQVATIKAYVR